MTKTKRLSFIIKPFKRLSVLLIPFRPVGRYVAGAWHELRVVRWPNRRATWSMLVAVVMFSIFFAAIILVMDRLFEYLFREVLLR